ncbi:MAG: hypothetical protein KatS3mg124_0335 [Porticoccaceae bacterium]|nr:MAG: hypothetical protein KatS3mg124_0335 [Porticoccaceae bacterium]
MNVTLLMMENVAISRYIQMANAQHLKAELPQVVIAKEATRLASKEVVLSPEQLRQIYSPMKGLEEHLATKK